MRYVGQKYTSAEATAIMESARATVRQVDEDRQQWAEENCRREMEALRQRDGADRQHGGAPRFVVKTRDHARAAPEPAAAQTMDAQTASWCAWVDARIDQKINAIVKAMDQELGELFDKQHESLQSALDRRDAAIKALRDEVEIKLGLSRKLARLKSEITEARAMQPNFQAELDSLREQNAKLQKTVTRLRGAMSEVQFAQQQLETQQEKNRREVSVTAVQMTTYGQKTREVLEFLRAEGIDFIDEWAPSGLAS
jgi:hypothetical protein